MSYFFHRLTLLLCTIGTWEMHAAVSALTRCRKLTSLDNQGHHDRICVDLVYDERQSALSCKVGLSKLAEQFISMHPCCLIAGAASDTDSTSCFLSTLLLVQSPDLDAVEAHLARHQVPTVKATVFEAGTQVTQV